MKVTVVLSALYTDVVAKFGDGWEVIMPLQFRSNIANLLSIPIADVTCSFTLIDGFVHSVNPTKVLITIEIENVTLDPIPSI